METTTPLAPAAPGPQTDADVAVYYAFIEEVVHRGVTEATGRFLAANFVEHCDATIRLGPEVLTWLAMRRARFPGAVWVIDLLVGVCGLVVCQCTMTCETEAGQPMRVSETVVARIADGRIAECWRASDD
jgi:predicted ester cyclase